MNENGELGHDSNVFDNIDDLKQRLQVHSLTL